MTRSRRTTGDEATDSAAARSVVPPESGARRRASSRRAVAAVAAPCFIIVMLLAGGVLPADGFVVEPLAVSSSESSQRPSNDSVKPVWTGQHVSKSSPLPDRPTYTHNICSGLFRECPGASLTFLYIDVDLERRTRTKYAKFTESDKRTDGWWHKRMRRKRGKKMETES